jgi:hypothetical protein
MKFKELKNQIKEEQKELASQIKKLKAKRKETPDGYISGLDRKRSTYRHKHIAYCQFFNQTPYEKIERSCHEGPNTFIIDNYIKEWYDELEFLTDEDMLFENVCDCA